jgi:hypothetical protein
MFHVLEMTLPSSYCILYVQGQSTSWMMNAPLRTMCGSRTGGWSLPCVMTD